LQYRNTVDIDFERTDVLFNRPDLRLFFGHVIPQVLEFLLLGTPTNRIVEFIFLRNPFEQTDLLRSRRLNPCGLVKCRRQRLFVFKFRLVNRLTLHDRQGFPQIDVQCFLENFIDSVVRLTACEVFGVRFCNSKFGLGPF